MAFTSLSTLPGFPEVIGVNSLALSDSTGIASSNNLRIRDIQGIGLRSPLENEEVVDISGIVTVVARNGFYLQDPDADDNSASSEGIFVFTGSSPQVSAGDSVLVSGIVREFFPGNNEENQPITQIEIDEDTAIEIDEDTAGVQVVSSGNPLPTAVLIGSDGLLPPTEVISPDGILFYEGLEGMRVTVQDAVAISPTSNFRSNSEVWVLANQGVDATGLNNQGGITIAETDFNPERIQIDDGLLRTLFQDRNGNPIVPLPQVNVGFSLGDVTGVMSFAFGNYEILATEPFNPVFGGLQPEVTEIVGTEDRLTIASYNVENLNPFAGIRFEALASQVVNNLKSPDIIALQEIQDNNGPINDGTVAADVTYQFLIDAIEAAGGPTYEFVNIDPENNQDGGQPGSNIRVGYLYNSERVELVPGSVRRIVDTDLSDGDAFEASRRPLVATFLFNGEEVTAINNHLTSRRGGSPLFGTLQPPRIGGDEARAAQAQILNNEVDAILAADPDANVVVLGDLNGFDFEAFQAILQGGDTPVLQNLSETLPERERYTFNFQGNSQALDHVLVSNNLAANAEYDIVHVNVDFVDQQADHDPLLVSLALPDDTSSGAESIRFASYNVALNRSTAGRLFEDLSTPNQQQIKNVAEIIQRVNPDVLLINEMDFDAENPLRNPQLFIDNYLEVQQSPDVEPITYDYIYIAPSNTGIASGFDLNRDGRIVTIPETPGFGNDAWGFGNFPGQFAMVLLSKYPIITEDVRTFQNFLWKDMPGAVLPDDIDTPEPQDWYSPEILEQFRLSSKSHWDVPINVNGTVIHVLASHPTPPVFDGPEDRNGLRNTDEIRFWSDYVTPGQGDYIYDDNGGTGGLEEGSHFVIMGDLNADPFDGSSTPPAILQLLENPNIQGSVDDPALTPGSAGGVAAATRQGGANLTHQGNPAFDTADFNDENPGNLRVDYVLPSNNLEIDRDNLGVFWLTEEDPNFERLIGDFNPNLDRENFPEGFLSSDHLLVYMDVTPVAEPNPILDDLLAGGLTGVSDAGLAALNFAIGLGLDAVLPVPQMANPVLAGVVAPGASIANDASGLVALNTAEVIF